MIPFAASIFVKATAVTLLALGGSRLARHARASVRHLLFAAAFIALLALPLASLAVPPIRIPVPVPAAATQAPSNSGPVVETGAFPVERSASPNASSRRDAAWPSWPLLVSAIWALGSTLFLLPVCAGLLQIRALRRTGLPWRDGQSIADRLARDLALGRSVDVLVHESVPGPLTCGVLHPVILLPADARSWAADDLWRAVVHEMEHVRRADWLMHCIARGVAALYWCHPLVWTAWRELSLEAERACDDAVIVRADATVYADQLVLFAERLAASNRHVPAMANRHDLLARVRAVLDSRQRRGRAGARSVATAAAMSALIVAAISPIRIVASAPSPAATQSASPAQRFAAVTIKPCSTESEPPPGPRGRGAGGGNVSASPGSLRIDCMTVQTMIDRAYGFFGEPLLNEQGPPREDTPRVKGGPAWVRSEKYTLEATADAAADRKTLMGPMLRAFLEDRLQLQLHRDSEEVPAYALTVAKGGLRVAPITSDAECKPECGMVTRGAKDAGTRVVVLGGMEREILVTVLRFDRLVIDRTGLPESDRYNFRLEYPDDPQRQPGDPAGPDVFRALEQQIGLKLEPIKAPHGIFVIDKVVRP